MMIASYAFCKRFTWVYFGWRSILGAANEEGGGRGCTLVNEKKPDLIRIGLFGN
jgi:hypothetical protein